MDDDLEATPSAGVASIDQNGIPVYQELIVPDLADRSIAEHGGSRLMITHIVNENFKSYAGVQTLGPFHKNFTAIIGPNGSGKSNVIDSMLFVFGYRASKIRSKKIGVLIHNSEAHTDVQSCTVSVHFQRIRDSVSEMRDDDYEAVEDSQFVVSRTAFRDNSSYYKINNRKVQFKEVEQFLNMVGVDLVHNRFLILQGEVELIAMMKSKAQNKNEDGLLEFLEDIIGSGRLKEPIEVLARRVEELGELKTEKYNRVKAIEKEKNELEEAKNEAVAYLELENEVIKNRNISLQKKLLEAEKLEREVAETMAASEEELKECEAQMKEFHETRKEKANRSKEAIRKFDEVDKECEAVEEEFRRFEQQDIRCQEDAKHCRNNYKTLEKALQQEETKLAQFKLLPERKGEEAQRLKPRLEKLQVDKQKEQERFNEVLASFQDKTKDLQMEKEAKEKCLLERQKSVNAAKQEYQLKQAELDLLKSNQIKEATKLADIKRNMGRIQDALKEKNGLLEEVSEKLPNSEAGLEKGRKDLSELNKVAIDKDGKARELRMKVEISRSNMQAAQNQNRVLNFLMNLKRKGNLPGIHGRLGDLGAIDEKYDVAVSTACGYLDYVVVDDMDTAQRCMEALRRDSVGQATFIGLDHMAKWKESCSKRISPPENVPRLFDLVNVRNKELLPAFYFALRDTLVAKDLDQAARIAYGSQRYRVVTLGGQLIDLSGTMSGGGNKVIRGKMGSKLAEEVDPKDLENMEKELEKILREAEACNDNRFKLQEVVEKMQRSHRDMSHSAQKLTNEIKNLEEQFVVCEKREREQESAMAATPDKKKTDAMEKKVASLREAYEKLQKVSSDLEEEIHQIHKRIMDIGGMELKSIETRMALLNTEIDQLNSTLTEIDVCIKTAQRNYLKSETKAASLRQELEDNKTRLKDLDVEKSRIEVEADVVLNKLGKAKEEKKIYQELLAKVSAEVAKLDEQHQEVKRRQIQIKHKLEKIKTEEVEIKERVVSLRAELGELVLNPVDGVEAEFKKYSEEELMQMDSEEIAMRIAEAQNGLKGMKPNMAAITEYKKKEDLYLKRMSEMTQVSQLKDQQRKRFDELRKKRLDEFMAGFGQITNKLKEMYQMITLGGDAELELVDSLDPFSEGVVFSVRPPKKSWKNISNLSGGEKTLSSLALVFALHHYKPTPFYVMDEIDAALDFRNVSIVAHYIKDRTKNAQFIVISLRNNMYELCDRLVGIYKTYNCTHSTVVDPHAVA